MFDEGAHAITPVEALGLQIRAVWHVEADSTYDVMPRRDRRELILIRTLEGEGELSFGSEKIRVTPGSVFICDFTQVTRYRCSGDSWHFYWFEFLAASLKGIPLKTVMSVPAVSGEVKELEEAFMLVRRNNPAGTMYATAILGNLLYRYVYRWQTQSAGVGSHHHTIERVVEFMHRNLKGLSIAEMAKQAYLSERRFRQVFEEITGKSPKEFYDILRLETAGNLLIKSGASLVTIAERLGYSSAFHFSKAFKKHVGVSPLRYRQQSRKMTA